MNLLFVAIDAVILALSGVGILVLTADILKGFASLAFCQRATGEVVGWERDEGCWFPRVRVPRGSTHFEFVSKTGRGKKSYRVGQTVRVLVSESKPEQSEIYSLSTLFFVNTFALLLCVLCFWGTLAG